MSMPINHCLLLLRLHRQELLVFDKSENSLLVQQPKHCQGVVGDMREMPLIIENAAAACAY